LAPPLLHAAENCAAKSLEETVAESVAAEHLVASETERVSAGAVASGAAASVHQSVLLQ
jgi:hypothetical protein